MFFLFIKNKVYFEFLNYFVEIENKLFKNKNYSNV